MKVTKRFLFLLMSLAPQLGQVEAMVEWGKKLAEQQKSEEMIVAPHQRLRELTEPMEESDRWGFLDESRASSCSDSDEEKMDEQFQSESEKGNESDSRRHFLNQQKKIIQENKKNTKSDEQQRWYSNAMAFYEKALESHQHAINSSDTSKTKKLWEELSSEYEIYARHWSNAADRYLANEAEARWMSDLALKGEEISVNDIKQRGLASAFWYLEKASDSNPDIAKAWRQAAKARVEALQSIRNNVPKIILNNERLKSEGTDSALYSSLNKTHFSYESDLVVTELLQTDSENTEPSHESFSDLFHKSADYWEKTAQALMEEKWDDALEFQKIAEMPSDTLRGVLKSQQEIKKNQNKEEELKFAKKIEPLFVQHSELLYKQAEQREKEALGKAEKSYQEYKEIKDDPSKNLIAKKVLEMRYVCHRAESVFLASERNSAQKKLDLDKSKQWSVKAQLMSKIAEQSVKDSAYHDKFRNKFLENNENEETQKDDFQFLEDEKNKRGAWLENIRRACEKVFKFLEVLEEDSKKLTLLSQDNETVEELKSIWNEVAEFCKSRLKESLPIDLKIEWKKNLEEALGEHKFWQNGQLVSMLLAKENNIKKDRKLAFPKVGSDTAESRGVGPIGLSLIEDEEGHKNSVKTEKSEVIPQMSRLINIQNAVLKDSEERCIACHNEARKKELSAQSHKSEKSTLLLSESILFYDEATTSWSRTYQAYKGLLDEIKKNRKEEEDNAKEIEGILSEINFAEAHYLYWKAHSRTIKLIYLDDSNSPIVEIENYFQKAINVAKKLKSNIAKDWEQELEAIKESVKDCLAEKVQQKDKGNTLLGNLQNFWSGKGSSQTSPAQTTSSPSLEPLPLSLPPPLFNFYSTTLFNQLGQGMENIKAVFSLEPSSEDLKEGAVTTNSKEELEKDLKRYEEVLKGKRFGARDLAAFTGKKLCTQAKLEELHYKDIKFQIKNSFLKQNQDTQVLWDDAFKKVKKVKESFEIAHKYHDDNKASYQSSQLDDLVDKIARYKVEEEWLNLQKSGQDFYQCGKIKAQDEGIGDWLKLLSDQMDKMKEGFENLNQTYEEVNELIPKSKGEEWKKEFEVMKVWKETYKKLMPPGKKILEALNTVVEPPKNNSLLFTSSFKKSNNLDSVFTPCSSQSNRSCATTSSASSRSRSESALNTKFFLSSPVNSISPFSSRSLESEDHPNDFLVTSKKLESNITSLMEVYQQQKTKYLENKEIDWTPWDLFLKEFNNSLTER